MRLVSRLGGPGGGKRAGVSACRSLLSASLAPRVLDTVAGADWGPCLRPIPSIRRHHGLLRHDRHRPDRGVAARRCAGDAPLVRRSPHSGDEVRWTPGEDLDPLLLRGVSAVVNLAGAPVADRRWTHRYMDEIRASRLAATTTIATAISRMEDPPRVLLSQSGIGFYGPTGDRAVAEDGPRVRDTSATSWRIGKLPPIPHGPPESAWCTPAPASYLAAEVAHCSECFPCSVSVWGDGWAAADSTGPGSTFA